MYSKKVLRRAEAIENRFREKPLQLKKDMETGIGILTKVEFGEYCPNKPVYKIGYRLYLCELCYKNYLQRNSSYGISQNLVS